MNSLDLLSIGNRLFELRTSMHLSQYDLAEKAGISGRTYADIERGETNMRVSTLIAICNALKVTPNDVLLSEESLDYMAGTERIIETLKGSNTRTKKKAYRILDAFLKD